MKYILLTLVLLLTQPVFAHSSSHHTTKCIGRQVGYDLYQDCTKYDYGRQGESYTVHEKDYYTPENIAERERSSRNHGYVLGCLLGLLALSFLSLICLTIWGGWGSD